VKNSEKWSVSDKVMCTSPQCIFVTPIRKHTPPAIPASVPVLHDRLALSECFLINCCYNHKTGDDGGGVFY